MTRKTEITVASAISLALGWFGAKAPGYRMPIDYDAIISVSVPVAALWTAVLVICVWRLRWAGLWFLIGSPLVLYWPVWRLFNHLPSCYYAHNCI